MRSCMARGITLIEVVAGLALMGTLLAVILVSSSQHLRQLKAAQDKRESVRRLDDFLASWSISQFQSDGIVAAVERSGLSATGAYGTYGPGDQPTKDGPEFQVDLRRAASQDFDSGDVVRLTVSVGNQQKDPKPTAWAEVLVPQ